MHRLPGCLCVAGVLTVSLPAAASEASVPTWKWRHFQAWEYGATAAALGIGFYLRFATPPPSANWTEGVLLDDWTERRFAIESVPQRERVKRLTDVLFVGSMAYRLVDSAILPLTVWRDPELALELSMIDLESFSFVALTLWGGQALFGRERPYASRCADAEFAAAEGGCPERSVEHNRSFYAGHPAVVMTAAGLTCTHHAHLALYGGAADTIACGTLLGAAVVTGAGRAMTEEHHLSDVVIGWSAGAFAGFALPELLHYRKPPPEVPSGGKRAISATVGPVLDGDQVGLALRGQF